MGVGGGQLLAVITPGLLGIFSNLRQRWKATDLFLTSIKVSFVAPLTVRILSKRGKKMKKDESGKNISRFWVKVYSPMDTKQYIAKQC